MDRLESQLSVTVSRLSLVVSQIKPSRVTFPRFRWAIVGWAISHQFDHADITMRVDIPAILGKDTHVLRQNENRSRAIPEAARWIHVESSKRGRNDIIRNSHLGRTVSLSRSWWHRATLIYFNGVTDLRAALIRAAKLHYWPLLTISELQFAKLDHGKIKASICENNSQKVKCIKFISSSNTK